MVDVVEDLQTVASGGYLKIKPGTATAKWSIHNIYTTGAASLIKSKLNQVTGENVGTGDGITTTFTLANTPVEEYSETVYIDSVTQTRDTDYTINYETGQITFTAAPASGSAITADYQYRVEVMIDSITSAGGWLNFAFYVVQDNYLRVKNDDSVAIKIGYDGVVVGV